MSTTRHGTLPLLPVRRPAHHPLRAASRGMTLVEIMVGTALLAMVGATLLAVFVQNFRMSKIQAFRSQAVTTSLTVLEQMRFLQYPQIETVYNAGTSGAFSVRIADPSQTTDYATLSLPVNVRDGTLQSATWTTANVVIDPDPAKPKLPMRFFLTLKRNRQTSGTKIDLFEIVLLYQYLNQGRGTSNWETGNVRLIVPSLNSLN
jgi:type II secretory pathway pseudopilin PulG